MKKLFKILGSILLTLVLCFGALVGYLMATEYKPKDVEVLTLQNTIKQQSESVQIGKEYTALDWNIGYAGLDKDEDFFMDGGKMVLPLDKAHVEENIKNITQIIKDEKCGCYFYYKRLMKIQNVVITLTKYHIQIKNQV